ncbi:MAG: hypothetical protein ACHREM_01980 [Polyangiales bacterium]
MGKSTPRFQRVLEGTQAPVDAPRSNTRVRTTELDTSPISSREVRIEQWARRAFFISPCAFKLGLPLDMSGCIVSAMRDLREGPYRRAPGGLILATDARLGGAIMIEVETSEEHSVDGVLSSLSGDLLARAVVGSLTGMRLEVDELKRWGGELGRDVTGFYVAYVEGPRPRSYVATRILGHLDGDEEQTGRPSVEHIVVASQRKSQAPRSRG